MLNLFFSVYLSLNINVRINSTRIKPDLPNNYNLQSATTRMVGNQAGNLQRIVQRFPWRPPLNSYKP